MLGGHRLDRRDIDHLTRDRGHGAPYRDFPQQPSASSSHPGRQVRDLRLQLGQRLPQPRVCSTKPRITTVGNAGHLGHAPNYTTTQPNPAHK